MSHKRFMYLIAVAALFAGAGVDGQAQSSSAAANKPAASAEVPEGGMPRYIRPETPEQRQERLGTAEDPGPNPDEKTIFWRFGKKYTIFKAEKRFAKYLPEPGMVRPLANANFTREIYQENDKYVWVWNEVLDLEDVDPNESKYFAYTDEHLKYFEELRSEFEPLDLADSSKRIVFEESSKNLPVTGSWRNGGDIADMNKDGHPDLVLPPQRGPAGTPAVFLGDGKGGWTRWNVKFPRQFNYGSVVAADFNKDKNMDLAFSVHLTGVALFLGDGKGGFREVKDGLDAKFPTRRLVATDVDADGWTDFVVISEGPVGRGVNVQTQRFHGPLRAFLNRNKGQKWEGIDLAGLQEYIGGDYLTAGNFNGDRYPDFTGSSVYFNSTETLFLSKGAKDYDPWMKGLVIPARSYYHATTAGRFSRSSKTDEAVVSFGRVWPDNLNPKLVPLPPRTSISGIDRITFADGEPKRVPIVRWDGQAPVRGMDSGDFDGDGNLDVAYIVESRLHILLGDGKGGFQSASVAGLELPPQRTYDLRAADVNGDRRPDLMVMFESQSATAFAVKNGSVRVYLNRQTEQVGRLGK